MIVKHDRNVNELLVYDAGISIKLRFHIWGVPKNSGLLSGAISLTFVVKKVKCGNKAHLLYNQVT